jgi:hypothetical protein
MGIPLFNGHEDPLDEETLEDLRADAFEKTPQAFVGDNEFHDLHKAPKWLSISFSRRLRL